MNYRQLIPTNKLLIIANHVDDWRYGSVAFIQYLKEETQLDIEIIEVKQEITNSSLPYEYFAHLLPHDLDDWLDNYTVLLNLPYHHANASLFDEIMPLLHKAQHSLAVVHDVLMARNYRWTENEPEVLYYHGSNVTQMRADQKQCFIQLLNSVDTVIYPSQFMQQAYNKCYGDTITTTQMVVANPYLSTICQFKLQHARKPKANTFMLASLYKQDIRDVVVFLNWLEKQQATLSILHSNMFDNWTHWYRSILQSSAVNILYDTSRYAVYNHMQQHRYFVDFTTLDESFGYLPREAAALGCTTFAKPYGALAEIDEANLHFIENADHLIHYLESKE